jgi:single-stranded DNA-binding protein
MNQVELQGHLTKDPELSDRSGTPVCDMRLAVNGPANTAPLFIDVVAFKDRAIECAESFGKGSHVHVRGALRYSEWEFQPTPKSKAQRRSKHSVLAAEVRTAA